MKATKERKKKETRYSKADIPGVFGTNFLVGKHKQLTKFRAQVVNNTINNFPK